MWGRICRPPIEWRAATDAAGLVPAAYDRESTVAPETLTPTEQAGEHTAADTVAEATIDGAAAPLVEDELLVEEVSIDGMCGVY